MTQTGMFVGKFRYASPEHLGFLPEGERIDGRADLYSLAVVLFEMLTGRPPFEATSPHEYIIHHSRDEYVSSPDLDRITGNPALQKVLARALDRDRNKRFATRARIFRCARRDRVDASRRTAGSARAVRRRRDDEDGADERRTNHRTVRRRRAADDHHGHSPAAAVGRPPGNRAGAALRRPPPARRGAADGRRSDADADAVSTAAPRSNTGTIILVSIIVLLFLGALGAAGVIGFMKFRNSFGGTTTATTASTTTTTTTVDRETVADVGRCHAADVGDRQHRNDVDADDNDGRR